LPTEAADHIDLFERVRGASCVNKRRRHIGGPELTADPSLLHPRQIGVDVLQRPIRIHQGEIVVGPFADHFGEIVVGVDHRDRPVKRLRPLERAVGRLCGGGLAKAQREDGDQ
jgi:hypothetical protein